MPLPSYLQYNNINPLTSGYTQAGALPGSAISNVKTPPAAPPAASQTGGAGGGNSLASILQTVLGSLGGLGNNATQQQNAATQNPAPVNQTSTAWRESHTPGGRSTPWLSPAQSIALGKANMPTDSTFKTMFGSLTPQQQQSYLASGDLRAGELPGGVGSASDLNNSLNYLASNYGIHLNPSQYDSALSIQQKLVNASETGDSKTFQGLLKQYGGNPASQIASASNGLGPDGGLSKPTNSGLWMGAPGSQTTPPTGSPTGPLPLGQSSGTLGTPTGTNLPTNSGSWGGYPGTPSRPTTNLPTGPLPVTTPGQRQAPPGRLPTPLAGSPGSAMDIVGGLAIPNLGDVPQVTQPTPMQGQSPQAPATNLTTPTSNTGNAFAPASGLPFNPSAGTGIFGQQGTATPTGAPVNPSAGTGNFSSPNSVTGGAGANSYQNWITSMLPNLFSNFGTMAG